MGTKWTPGPWRVEPTFETDESDPQEIRTQRLILAGDRQYIAETMSNHAHLIASAPELYEALDKLLGACRSYDDKPENLLSIARYAEAVERADAALRKARGE